jgi:outer membrane receptor for ferrienterochelin and colicin
LGIENGGIRDNSDFRQYNWTGKAKYHFSDNNALAISSGYYTSTKGIPSPTDFAQYRRFEEWKRCFTDLTGGFLLSNKVNIRSKMYYDNFKNEMIEYTNKTLDSITWDSFHDHWNAGSIVAIDIPFYSHTLTAGFNGKYEVASTKGYMGAALETYYMSTGSVVLEGSFQVAKRLSLTTGIGASGAFPRDNEGSLVQRKTAFNGIAGINGQFLMKGKYHCGIGIYNRYPTLNQLFSSERGNPDLRSETALNIDAGVEYTFINCLSAGVTIFDEEFKDLITNYRIEGTAISRYQNIARACSRGVETNLLLEIPKIDCKLSFNYICNATRDFKAAKSLPYVPVHSIGGGINLSVFEGGIINFHVLWIGERTGQNEYTVYDDYFILDGRAAYRWKVVTMALTVKNIFDVHYATEEPAYPAPGRMVKGDIAISFRREIK